MDECPQRITQSLMQKMAERIDRLEKIHEEDQAKLVALQADLSDVRGKLGTLVNARDEEQEKLKQQIKDLRKENTLLLGK